MSEIKIIFRQINSDTYLIKYQNYHLYEGNTYLTLDQVPFMTEGLVKMELYSAPGTKDTWVPIITFEGIDLDQVLTDIEENIFRFIVLNEKIIDGGYYKARYYFSNGRVEESNELLFTIEKPTDSGSSQQASEPSHTSSQTGPSMNDGMDDMIDYYAEQ